MASNHPADPAGLVPSACGVNPGETNGVNGEYNKLPGNHSPGGHLSMVVGVVVVITGLLSVVVGVGIALATSDIDAE
jgi:hypothetical protein